MNSYGYMGLLALLPLITALTVGTLVTTYGEEPTQCTPTGQISSVNPTTNVANNMSVSGGNMSSTSTQANMTGLGNTTNTGNMTESAGNITNQNITGSISSIGPTDQNKVTSKTDQNKVLLPNKLITNGPTSKKLMNDENKKTVQKTDDNNKLFTCGTKMFKIGGGPG